MTTAIRVLVVCTANRCRSPLGEALLRRFVREKDLNIEVRSAGTKAIDGLPPTGGTELAAKKLKVDVTEILSKPITPESSDWADLIITMERQHVIDTVAEFPDVFNRTFLITELRDLLAQKRPTPDMNLRQWLAEVSKSRTRALVLSSREADDVADPAGQSLRKHNKAAREIYELLETITDGLTPLLTEPDHLDSLRRP